MVIVSPFAWRKGDSRTVEFGGRAFVSPAPSQVAGFQTLPMGSQKALSTAARFAPATPITTTKATATRGARALNRPENPTAPVAAADTTRKAARDCALT